MDDTTIDLEQVMAQITAQAAALPREIPAFAPVANFPAEESTFFRQLQSLQTNLQRAHGLKNVLSERPTVGKGLLSYLSCFAKKIIRKFSRFYIVPIVDDQNHFNASSVDCLQDITNQLQTIQQSFAQLGITDPSQCGYERAQLENFVYETIMQKVTALELQTQKLLYTNAALEAESAECKRHVLEQAQALHLLQHQYAVLEKKVELAALTKQAQA